MTMENDLVGLKMRHALNCWNDGLNDHLYGPPTIERATELIRWADSHLLKEMLSNAETCDSLTKRIQALEAELARKTEADAEAAFIPLQDFVDDLENGADPERVTFLLLKEVQDAIRARSASEEKTDV